MSTSLQNTDPKTITKLLHEWRDGDQDAFSSLIERVYYHLKSIANNLLAKEPRNHGLRATAIVNEAYTSLERISEIEWEDRRHFFNLAGKVMRHCIIEEARKNKAKKRGGPFEDVALEDGLVFGEQPGPDDYLNLDRLLTEMERFNPEGVRIVELRFFVGFTIEETSQLMDISQATVKRKWEVAKSWLFQRMRP